MVLWICEARNRMKELREYTKLVDVTSKLCGWICPMRLPKCRGYLKTMFGSMDITPFYLGILIVTGMMVFAAKGDDAGRMLASDSARKDILYYRGKRVVANTKLARVRGDKLMSYVENSLNELKCCSSCSCYCLCAKECKCRRNDKQKKDR